jgi:hypothetical protein
VRSCGLDASGSGWGPVAGCCEHGNEPSGSIKGGEFLTSWATVKSWRRTALHGVGLSMKFLCHSQQTGTREDRVHIHLYVCTSFLLPRALAISLSLWPLYDYIWRLFKMRQVLAHIHWSQEKFFCWIREVLRGGNGNSKTSVCSGGGGGEITRGSSLRW